MFSGLFIITGSGLLAGFLTGLVSLGGAFIVVPAIYAALMVDGATSHSAFTTAVATSIAFVFASSATAAVSYARKSMIDYRLLALICVSAAFGVWLGIETLLQSDDQIVRWSFGAFIWAMGLYMFLSKRYKWGQEHAGKSPTYQRFNQALLVVISVGVGFLVAVFGIGGGGVLAPAIALLFRSDMKRAIATAVAATVLIALYGLSGYVIKGLDGAATIEPSLGWIYLPALAVLIPCAFIAAPLGVKVAMGLKQSTLTLIVTLTMFFIGARFVTM